VARFFSVIDHFLLSGHAKIQDFNVKETRGAP